MLEWVATTLTWQRETGGWVFPSTSCTLGTLTPLIHRHVGKRTAEPEVVGTGFKVSAGRGKEKKKSEHVPKSQHPPEPIFTLTRFLHTPRETRSRVRDVLQLGSNSSPKSQR